MVIAAAVLWPAAVGTAGAQELEPGPGTEGDDSGSEVEPGEPAPQPETEQEDWGPAPEEAQGVEEPAAAPPPVEEEHAEDVPAPNSLYGEGLGAGLFYSINYERLVIPDLAARVGFGFVKLSATGGGGSASSSYLSIPLTASYIGLRKGSSALEVGGGATLVYVSGQASTGVASASGSGMTAYGNILAGYRLHPVGGAGFQFRIGLMMLLGKGLRADATDPGAFGFLPWGYISFGASF